MASWFPSGAGDTTPKICIVEISDIGAALGKARQANKTRTTKYNLFTYLPKALFEQYR